MKQSDPLLLQDEIFTVLEGKMGYSLDGKEGVTTKGVTVPVGRHHTFWNADPKTILTVKVIPLHHVHSQHKH